MTQKIYMHNLWVNDSLTQVIPEQNLLICGSFLILAETSFQLFPTLCNYKQLQLLKKVPSHLHRSFQPITQVSHVASELLDFLVWINEMSRICLGPEQSASLRSDEAAQQRHLNFSPPPAGTHGFSERNHLEIHMDPSFGGQSFTSIRE